MVLPLVVFLAQTGSFSDMRRDYAVGEKDAYLMLPAEAVCGSSVKDMVWTADGTSLVVEREIQDATPADVARIASGVPPSPEEAARFQPHTEIVMWSAKTHRLKTVLNVPSGAYVGDLQTMAGTDRIFFDTTERAADPSGGPERTVTTITMLTTGNGEMKRLSSFTQDAPGRDALFLSPKRPLGALLSFDGESGWHVRFFGPSGVSGPRFSVRASELSFDDSGAPGIPSTVVANKKLVAMFLPIDPATGNVGEPVRDTESKPVALPLTALSTLVGTDVAAPTVFLKAPGGKPDEAGIVTTDGSRPKVSPRLDAVAYVGQGSAFVRPLVKVSREAFEKARIAALKTIAISNAKQVGLGLLMYSADSDDAFPGAGADIRNVIGPYVKNDRLFDGFNYTFGGGNAMSVEKPAETALGYVSGPGGRAVVYVDGHVKWVPDGS